MSPEQPCGTQGRTRALLRPGVTVNLAQQEFILPLSCKSWLAGLPYIEVMNETASQGDDERNNRAAISFAAVVLRDNYPEITEGLVVNNLDVSDLRALYEAVQRAEEQGVTPLVASSEGITIPWSAGERRLVPLLVEDDFAAFGPEIEWLMTRPVLAEVVITEN